jgi:hypothetical protein
MLCSTADPKDYCLDLDLRFPDLTFRIVRLLILAIITTLPKLSFMIFCLNYANKVINVSSGSDRKDPV